MNIVREAIEGVETTLELRKADMVAKYIPPKTKFVTVATFSTVDDVKALKRSTHFSFQGVTTLKSLGQPVAGYLAHDGVNLYFISESKTEFNFPLTEITHAEYFNDGSSAIKILFYTPSTTYLAGFFTAIKIPSGSSLRTGMDWYPEFEKLGVITPAEQAAYKRSVKMGFIIWFVIIVLFVGVNLVLLYLSKRYGWASN